MPTEEACAHWRLRLSSLSFGTLKWKPCLCLGHSLLVNPENGKCASRGAEMGQTFGICQLLLCSGVPVFSTSPSGQLTNGFRNILLHLTVLLVVPGRKVSLRVNCMSYCSAAVLKYHDKRPLKGPRVFMACISRYRVHYGGVGMA